jgi:hypothetical protein
MRVKREVAIAVAMVLVLGGLTATAVAGGFARFYTTPVSYSMIFGSSGNIGAASTGKPGSVGPVYPGSCILVGVGDFIPATGCPTLLSSPYELTETPIAASKGTITYFTVTTTNPAPAGGGNYINFSIRLCEDGVAPYCNVSPPGGITKARCAPAAGSHTCSWVGKLPFGQWQPAGPATACPAGGSGFCHSKDPTKPADEGLIDIVMSRGCGSTCPNGTYDPGNVSWSVAYIK